MAGVVGGEEAQGGGGGRRDEHRAGQPGRDPRERLDRGLDAVELRVPVDGRRGRGLRVGESRQAVCEGPAESEVVRGVGERGAVGPVIL